MVRRASFFIEEDERTPQLLNVALRVSNRSTYTLWIQYLMKGEGRQKGVAGEAIYPTCYRDLSFQASRRKEAIRTRLFVGLKEGKGTLHKILPTLPFVVSSIVIYVR